MAINQGQVKSYDVSQTSSNAHPAGVGQTPDVRRIYNFGDRVADLTPEESPFFVYLSKVSKVPTDDSVFRYLEDRSKIDWTSRDFALAAAVNGGSAVSAGSTYSFSVDANSDSVDWLIKGMVFAVRTTGGQEKIVMRLLEAKMKMGQIDVQSVLLLDDLKGYVVVEAQDPPSMFNAIQGIRHMVTHKSLRLRVK